MRSIKSPLRKCSVDDYVSKIASQAFQKFPISIVNSMRDPDDYVQFPSNLFTMLDEQILENILKHNL